MVDVEDEPCLQTAVDRLTDTEQEIIAQVLARDEEVRQLEELRLSRLNLELIELCEKGVPDGEEDKFGRVCLRCRSPLGIVTNSGAFCQRCQKRVCKDCRQPVNDTWLCTVCFKEREVKAESGAWFYDKFTKKGKRVYGSALLKRFFRRLRDSDGKLASKTPNGNSAKVHSTPVKGSEEGDDVYVIINQQEDGEFLVREGSIRDTLGDEEVLVRAEEEAREISVIKSDEKIPEEPLFEDATPDLDITAPVLERQSSFGSDTPSIDEDFQPSSIIAGEILLGMKYEERDKQFQVQIHRVRDLPPADGRKNTTDPYVKTYLLPDKSKSGKRKTKAKKHSLNPEFDEILTYKISYEELMTRKLWVSVWHHDVLGHNLFLGEVIVVLEAFVMSGFSLQDPIPQWYTLAERTLTRGELKNVGNIKVSLKYVPPGSVPVGAPKAKSVVDPASGILLVKVVEAKNLKAVREDGTSNPFCRIDLLPNESRSKAYQFKTSPQNGTVHPHWDQEFTLANVAWNGLHKQVLEIVVYDHEPKTSPIFLGGTRMGLGRTEETYDDPFGPEMAVWKTMLDNPNEWNSVTIPLRSAMESLKQDTSAPPVHVKRIQEEALLIRDSKTGSLGSLEDIGSVKKRSLLRNADQLSLQSFGSMLSIYSDSGGQSSLPISGDILFSIKYDSVAGVFEIVVIKAKNLAIASQRSQSSDPYVKTYLLPDKSKSSKKKTSTRRRTINPEWNDTIKYKIGPDDLMKRTLQLSVWHYDKLGQNDFLGEVQIQIQKYVKSGHSLSDPEPVWYTLQDMAPVSIGQPGFQGDLTIAIKFDSDNNKLIIDVRGAKGLPAADSDGTSDPFVKSYLLPDKSRKTKRKTKALKKTLEPKWNEKLEYEGITRDDLEQIVVELTVWDQDKKGHNFLGGTRVGLKSGDEPWHDCIGKEVQIWEAVIDHQNIWNEYTIPLRDSMTSRKGMDLEPPATMAVTLATDTKVDPGVAVIRLGLKYSETTAGSKGILYVHVKEARYLPEREDGQAPNTLCKCAVVGKKRTQKKKVDIYLRSTNPIWDQEVEFHNFALEELEQRGLEVQVFDDFDGKSTSQIGLVRLGLGQLRGDWDDSEEKEIALWQAMLSNVNQWTYMMLRLRSPEKSSSVQKADVIESNIKVGVVTSKNEVEVKDSIYDSDAVPMKVKKDEGKSPKELALEIMGDSASNVLSILEKNETVASSARQSAPQQSQVTRPDLEKTSFDLQSDQPLSPIREEAEEYEEEKLETQNHMYQPPRVHFTPTVQVKETQPRPQPQTVVVPDVVVTEAADESVKPGDPPFKNRQQGDYTWEDNDDDILDLKKSKKDKDKRKSKLMKKAGFGSQESLGSIQSSRSEDLGVYGRVVVKGDIQLGMRYDFGGNILELHVFQGRDLAAVDTKNNTSDSYVKTYLMPDKTKATKKKTKVKKNTLDPEWDQIITYKFGVPELRTRVLVVHVWNRDRLSRNDFLGEVQFRMDNLFDQRGLDMVEPKWYPLQDKQPLLEPARFKGTLKLGLSFEDPDSRSGQKEDTEKKGKEKKKSKKKSKSKLIVHIIEAKDLPAGDRDGFSDPYCKCILLPLKGKTKKKTHTIRHTLNPVWDYRTEYDVDYEDLAELGLEISIWDWDRATKDDFLGCVRLNLGERHSGWDDAEGEEIKAWQALLDKPNRLHEYTLPVRTIKGFTEGLDDDK